MAGLFAVRALRAGREKFDPFGERSSDDDDDDDDNLDDVDEPEDDDTLVTAPAMKTQARFEKNLAESMADAAFDVSDEPTKKVSLAPITPLETFWETPCELIYEDDDAEVFSVRFSPDDKLLAAGCGDSVVRIFHGDDGRLAYNLEREGSHSRLPTTCLRWKPAAGGGTKNVLLAANADGTICHWHVTSRKCLHTISEENNQVYALDYTPDGSQFATAGKDFAVRVYDEATKSEVSKLASGWLGAPSAGHSNRIFSLKFVPQEPQLLLSAGWDNTIQIWDLRTNQPTGSMYGPHVCGDSIDAAGHEVVSGSWRPTKQLQIWDRRNPEQPIDVSFRQEGGTACHLYAAQYSKPGAAGSQLIAAGGSCANELKLFNRASLEPVGRLGLPRGVYGLDLAHDGRSVAVAGGDCKVRVMRIPGMSPAGAASAGASPPTGEAKAEAEPVRVE